MNKVFLYFLNVEPVKSFKKDEESNQKFLNLIKNLEKEILGNMKIEYEKVKNLINEDKINSKDEI